MSDYIDTREGWRRINVTEYTNAQREGKVVLMLRDNPGAGTYWVREEPVPPRPTEPYTVIRVTWKFPVDQGNSTVLTLIDGNWCFGDEQYGASLDDSLTGFEVLAEPVSTESKIKHDSWLRGRVRRETAKAVIDRVRGVSDSWARIDLALFNAVANEFGVE